MVQQSIQVCLTAGGDMVGPVLHTQNSSGGIDVHHFLQVCVLLLATRSSSVSQWVSATPGRRPKSLVHSVSTSPRLPMHTCQDCSREHNPRCWIKHNTHAVWTKRCFENKILCCRTLQLVLHQLRDSLSCKAFLLSSRLWLNIGVPVMQTIAG